MDDEKANEELKVVDYSDFKENAELKAIIAGQAAKKMSIKIADVEIAIKSAIPKAMRDKIVAVAKAYQNGDTENADEEMYLVLSKICINEPYTNPIVWKYLDEETGEIPAVLRAIIEKITDTEVSAKRFR